MTSPVNPGAVATGAASATAGAAIGVVRTVAEAAIPGYQALQGLDDALERAHAWTANRHNWVRVAWVGAGWFLVVAGVLTLARRPVGEAVRTAVKTVR